MSPVAECLHAGPGTLVVAEAGSAGLIGQAWGYLYDATGPAPIHTPTPGVGAWVLVSEGSAFTVPTGKLLVLTAIGSLVGGGDGTVSVDGVVVARVAPLQGLDSSVGPTALARGLTVTSGSTVTANDLAPGNDARAWGYLVDA